MNKVTENAGTVRERERERERELYFKEGVESGVHSPTSNNAITLIALIVTVIILLILAGVTLNMVIGENGLFGKANIAKEETNKSTATEKIKLKILEYKAEVTSKQEDETLKGFKEFYSQDSEIEYINLCIEDNGNLIEANEQTPTRAKIKLKDYSYEFIIDEKLNIISIDGKTNNDKGANEGELNLNDNVKKLFNSANYNFNLEEVMQNEEIMNELLQNEDVINYIISNDKIYNLALNNSKISGILSSNPTLLERMKNDSKWKAVPTLNLNNQYITDIKASYTWSNYEAKYAFDEKWDNINEVWSTYSSSNGGIGEYLICEFSEKVAISQIKIKPGTINSEYVKGFSIYGSNDGENYSKIYTGEHGNNNEFETYNVYSKQYFKYLKFEINSKYNSNVSIQEILYVGKVYSNSQEEKENVGNEYSTVNELFKISNYKISLEKILSNKQIVYNLIDNESGRNYIIGNDEIYEIEKKIGVDLLVENTEMYKMMINNDKWKQIMIVKELNSYIKEVKASYTYSNYYPKYAFDGKWDNNNLCWSTYSSDKGGIGEYIICEFNKNICLRNLKIKPGTINSEYVKEFTIYGSNDGENYTKVYTGEHENNDEFQEYAIKNTNLYRYLKLEINSKYNYNVSFQEIIYEGY